MKKKVGGTLQSNMQLDLFPFNERLGSCHYKHIRETSSESASGYSEARLALPLLLTNATIQINSFGGSDLCHQHNIKASLQDQTVPLGSLTHASPQLSPHVQTLLSVSFISVQRRFSHIQA